MRFYISEAITLKLEALLCEHFMTQYATELICMSNICATAQPTIKNADTLTFNNALLYTYMNLELPYAA